MGHLILIPNTDHGQYFLGSDSNRYYHYTTPKNHASAKAQCLSDGASLVSITRPETREFLRRNYGQKDRMWLSANNLDGGEYRWEFADGSRGSISKETSNWNPREPNGPNEHCVFSRNGDQWFDIDCNRHYEFLCQILMPEFRQGKMKTWPSRPIRCDVWIVKRTRYRQTDRPTDQPTDTAIYRGALSHLKHGSIQWKYDNH